MQGSAIQGAGGTLHVRGWPNSALNTSPPNGDKTSSWHGRIQLKADSVRAHDVKSVGLGRPEFKNKTRLPGMDYKWNSRVLLPPKLVSGFPVGWSCYVLLLLSSAVREAPWLSSTREVAAFSLPKPVASSARTRIPISGEVAPGGGRTGAQPGTVRKASSPEPAK